MTDLSLPAYAVKKACNFLVPLTNADLIEFSIDEDTNIVINTTINGDPMARVKKVNCITMCDCDFSNGMINCICVTACDNGQGMVNGVGG